MNDDSFSWKTLFETQLLILMRKDVLILLLVVLSVPVAISTAYGLVSPSLKDQAVQLLQVLEEKQSYVILPGTADLGCNCSRVYITLGRVIMGNNSLTVPIVYLDRSTFTRDLVYWPKNCLNNTNDSQIVSVSKFLSMKLGVKPGSVLRFCIDNQCNSYVVGCMHSNYGFYASSLVFISASNNTININIVGDDYVVCRTNDTSRPYSMLNRLTEFMLSFARYFTGFIALVYFPIIYLGYRRIHDIIENDLVILHELGARKRSIKLVLGVLLVLLGLLMIIYGICLGVFFMHLSIWALRFFGIIIDTKPIPDLRDVFFNTGIFTLVILVSTLLVYRTGDEKTL